MKNSGGKPMKWRFTALGPLILALCIFALPLHAQTSDTENKPVTHRQWYDISQEIRIIGTVSNVEKVPARGTETLPGSHLQVETNAGQVDASLGLYALRGKSPLSVSSRQQVQMLGVMKTIKGREVFIVRVIEVNGRSYAVRNEHGFANAALAHKGSAGSQAKGGQL
jgi:hypothetical protein